MNTAKHLDIYRTPMCVIIQPTYNSYKLLKTVRFLCPTLQNQYYMYTACSAVKAYAASHCTNERRDTAYSTVVLPWHVTVQSMHNCTWLRYCLLAVLALV